MSDKRIPFSDIGERFLGHILTPDLLRRELLASIPPDGLKAVETVSGYTVKYDAVVNQVEALRQDIRGFLPAAALKGYRFRFKIGFKLNLSVNVLQAIPLPGLDLTESFSVDGLIPLVLEAEIHDPLTLFIAYEPLKKDEVQIITEKGQWHDLAMRFGGLEQKVRSQVVRRVNTMLEDNLKVRTIDLFALVQKALDARASSKMGGKAAE